MRIVSLLPSATEIVCRLGGLHMLTGRSHECDFPDGLEHLPALTVSLIDTADPARIDQQVTSALATSHTLYRLDAAAMQSLKPDLIISQQLCEVCSVHPDAVYAAARDLDTKPDILLLNPHSFEDVLDDCLRVAQAAQLEPQGQQLVLDLRARFFAAADHVNPYADHPPVLFLEWTDPMFVGGHWVPQLIERAGGSHPLNPTTPNENAGAGAGGQQAHRTAGKSIRVTPEQVASSEPEFIISCPCGMTLDQAEHHTRAWLEQPWTRNLPAVRNNRIAVVDGTQMFARPGPRLVDAYEFLVGYLNDLPNLIPPSFPWSLLDAPS